MRSGSTPPSSSHVHASDSGLSAADDGVPVRGLRPCGEPIDRCELGVGVSVERRLVGRRHRGFEIARVDDLAPDSHARGRAGQGRDEHAVARIEPQVVAHGEELHLPRSKQVLAHHLVVVVADLRRRGTFIEARVEARVVDRIVAQDPRVHAVVGRGLMESHERIRIVPVAAGTITSIDHHHLGRGVGDQRVGERHARRARADHQVVGLDLSHRTSKGRPPAARSPS